MITAAKRFCVTICLPVAALSTNPANSETDSPTNQLELQSSTVAYSEKIMLAAAIGSELFLPTSKKSPDTLNQVPDDESALRLLEVRVGRYMLDDLISAYQVEDIILIPLGYLSELIDLSIDVDTANGTASGFIFKEERQFFLDINRGEITVAGKLSKFDKRQVAVRELDDIYVDSNLLGKWLPLKLDIDLFASQMKIISKEPLPFELRKKREDRINLVRSRATSKQRNYPLQIEPYKNWAYPMINQTARVGVTRNADGEFENTFGYSTYVTADLLRMESSWYLAGTEDDFFDEARVTFARRDPTGSLLGNLRASEYAFGYVNEPRLEIITKSIDPQPGATISNFPLARQLQYDSQNFRGPLPPGWSVELYRNNDLLDYIAFSDNGLYQFDDVPLLFGTNYFRLVFYGPQGQIEEENYRYTLDRALTRPGEILYRAQATQGKEFGYRSLVQYEHGLNKQFTLAANLASIPLDDRYVVYQPEEQHNYATAGARGFFMSMFYRTDLIKDMQSGTAIDWEIQSSFNGLILKLGETYFQDKFISEEFPETLSPIKQHTTIALDTAIPASLLPRIPITFDMDRKEYESGLAITQYGNRISANSHGLAITNTLNMNDQTGIDRVFSGNLQISKRAFGYNFRGSANYELEPDSGFQSATFTIDGFKLWGYHINSGYSRVIDTDIDEVFFNMNRTHGAYALGLNTHYSTGGILSVDLTFSIGIGREPRTNIFKPEFRPVASQGSMSVLAYLDKNSNDHKDPDEEGLQGAKIRINGGHMPQKADENGIVYLTGIEPYRELDVDLAVESLEDPLWQPKVIGKRISLRPGYVAQIDFPIMITGEIDGTAYVQLGDKQREVSGVIVELLDQQGKVIQTAKTAYDGFYLMSKIPAGKYQLRVSREQTDALNLLPVKPTFVVIEPDKPIVNGMDFVLQKQFIK
ncbi:hypothetical protein [Kaarinaea lacus]